MFPHLDAQRSLTFRLMFQRLILCLVILGVGTGAHTRAAQPAAARISCLSSRTTWAFRTPAAMAAKFRRRTWTDWRPTGCASPSSTTPRAAGQPARPPDRLLRPANPAWTCPRAAPPAGRALLPKLPQAARLRCYHTGKWHVTARRRARRRRLRSFLPLGGPRPQFLSAGTSGSMTRRCRR